MNCLVCANFLFPWQHAPIGSWGVDLWQFTAAKWSMFKNSWIYTFLFGKVEHTFHILRPARFFESTPLSQMTEQDERPQTDSPKDGGINNDITLGRSCSEPLRAFARI